MNIALHSFKQSFFLGLLLMLSLFVLSTETASAYLNNESPDPANTTNLNGDKLGHLVADATYISVPTTRLTIYSTSARIGVAIASADMCTRTQNIYETQDNPGPGIDYFSGAISRFTVSGDISTVNHSGVRNTACAAGKNVMNAGDPENVSLNAASELIIAKGKSPIATSEGVMYRYDFTAEFKQCTTIDYNSDGVADSCGVNYFRVKAMGISGGVYTNAKVVISQAAGAGQSERNGIGGYAASLRTTGVVQNTFFDYKVEFGSECSFTGATAQIEIYDDDNVNGPGAQDPNYPFGVRLEQSPKGSNAWSVVSGPAQGFKTVREGSSPSPIVAGSGPSGNIGRNSVSNGFLQVGTYGSKKYLYLEFNVQPDTQYRLTVRQLDPHNNLQFAYPFEAINQYKTCPGTGDDQYVVNFAPDVDAELNDAGDEVTFTQSVRVLNFPETKEWGFNEIARREANATNTAVIQKNYDANRDTKYNGVAVRKCQSGWAATCTNYQCGRPGNISYKSSCSVYEWRCEWGTNGTIHTNYNPFFNNDPYSGSTPACAEEYYQYQCKNASNQWYNAYVNQAGYGTDGCDNKWVCPNPSLIPSTHNPDDFAGRPNYCKIFTCAYNSDPANYFFDDNGNPRNKCERRCMTGTGGAPPLWASGDFNCYIQPQFYIQCNWDGTGGSSALQTVTKDNWTGTFCSTVAGGVLTRNASFADASGNICATTTPSGIGGGAFSWLANPMPVQPTNPNATILPPGKGDFKQTAGGEPWEGTGFTAYRANWVFGPPGSDRDCRQVGAHPYFSVLGGDIAAGPGFGTGCTTTSAEIIGSAKRSTPYDGAGAQLAALALGSIKSFATSHTQNAATGGTWVDSLSGGQSAASNLAFANSAETIGTGGGLYGGNLAKNDWCVPDYYSNADEVDETLTGSTIQVGSLTGGTAGSTYTYYVEGPIKLNVNNLDIPAKGQKVILKVNGNVFIDGPSSGPNRAVKYQNPSSLAAIPQFQLLAKGDIYVAPTITRLDGFYDAQGANGEGGVFATCGGAGGPIKDASTALGACRTEQLVVNGSIAAKTVMLNRTLGDRSGKFGQSQAPAETFVFSPQFWLPSVIKRNGIGPWQSVTSLPPIL